MVSQTNPLLCKKMLLFQDICTAADHVSKKAILPRVKASAYCVLWGGSRGGSVEPPN